ncbi:hypothetical protein DPEC_G00330100 [Dallia pectoralis]|uniref:Uncharacterized protein n=1 Tax=Dallia pectoralis TaxID=75939 RepID=A0ACC2F909_DALPE|nr:hypothetical protein DPEC_G00330100 [Dallia pectoralis]
MSVGQLTQCPDVDVAISYFDGHRPPSAVLIRGKLTARETRYFTQFEFRKEVVKCTAPYRCKAGLPQNFKVSPI